MAELALARRYAGRELRGGLEGFGIFLACLTIGVAAIAAVGSVSASIVAGLQADARDLLGGDVEFRLAQRLLPDETVAWLGARGRLSTVRELRGMVRTLGGDKRSLIELKSVDGAYPLFGAVELDPPLSLGEALAVEDGVAGLAVDAMVLDRLGVALGDRIRLGSAEFAIRAVLVKEPDGIANPFTLGPHVLVSAAGLALSGLDQPGTLSSSVYRLRLPAPSDAKAVIKAADLAFPESGWRARDASEAEPQLQSFVTRTSMFLVLVGLTSLLVGGVGVGNAASAYLSGKVPVIAILKSLGAPARLVYAIYLLQLFLLALLAIVVGLALGAAAPLLLHALGPELPVELRLGVYPRPLLVAAGFGLLTALGFSLWPLARARRVPAASLFRNLVETARQRLGWGDWAATAGVALALAALAIVNAQDKRVAAGFLAAVAVALVAFRLVGAGVMRAAAAIPIRRRPWLRLAIANLHRPGAATPSVVLSMGLGLTVLVAIGLIEGSLTHEVAERLPESAPSYFFIDIQPDEVAPFKALVESLPGTSDLALVPSLRTRITALDGAPPRDHKTDPDARWILNSERGLTYAAALPAGSHVVAGTWWPADYQGPPLISLDADLAAGLHLEIGDTVGFNIAGREITARIANFRKIDWTTLGINFFTIFAPGTLEAAPQTAIATIRAESPAAEARLAREVTEAFPNVSAIRVKDALDTLAHILGQMAAAIRAIAAITVLAGVLVLAGAIAATRRRRRYEAVVLKVLGATRAVIARGFLIEYGILGGVTAVISVALGSLASWLVVTQLLAGEWVFDVGRVVGIALGGTAATLAVALAGTWRVLGARAAPLLRNE
jgi:putative ABC transport system permease protein